MVDGQTKLRQQLVAQLKSYSPVVLDHFGMERQRVLAYQFGRTPGRTAGRRDKVWRGVFFC